MKKFALVVLTLLVTVVGIGTTTQQLAFDPGPGPMVIANDEM